MKKNSTLFLSLMGVIASFLAHNFVFAADSSFQIAPPPIAHPYFEPGKTDSKIEPIYINIAATDFSLSGGGINFDTRHVFTEVFALDVQGGLFALNGEMPGIPPITQIPAYSGTGTFLGYYTAQATGKAKVNMTSIQMSVNMEFQPIHGDAGGLIIFGGPNLGIMRMTMKTPYNLIYGATTYTGYTDTLSISSVTVGLQVGLQGDIAVSDAVRLTPFIMVSSSSGSSTLEDDPGVKDVDGTTSTADIPSTTSTSLGMDIVMGDLSIGTVLQQMAPKANETEGVKITMFRLGYRF